MKEKQTFERLVLTKDEALEMFSDNPFKVQLISNKIPEGGLTTVYKCGPLIDLCTYVACIVTNFPLSYYLAVARTFLTLAEFKLSKL